MLAATKRKSGEHQCIRDLFVHPAKFSLTLQLYAHSTMETKVEAMNCIEKYL